MAPVETPAAAASVPEAEETSSAAASIRARSKLNELFVTTARLAAESRLQRPTLAMRHSSVLSRTGTDPMLVLPTPPGSLVGPAGGCGSFQRQSANRHSLSRTNRVSKRHLPPQRAVSDVYARFNSCKIDVLKRINSGGATTAATAGGFFSGDLVLEESGEDEDSENGGCELIRNRNNVVSDAKVVIETRMKDFGSGGGLVMVARGEGNSKESMV